MNIINDYFFISNIEITNNDNEDIKEDMEKLTIAKLKEK
jgi:hypothetical protein